MALAFSVHYTVADYQQWEGQWELIEGVPVAMSPSPTIIHQSIAGKLFAELDNALGNCADCFAVLDVDWHISEDTVLKPDCVIVCNEQSDFIYKTPELIIEILSPSTSSRDEHYKFERYELEGVKHYIIVNPKTLVAKVYKLTNGSYIKVGDYNEDTITFDINGCTAKINFKTVFARFKK